MCCRLLASCFLVIDLLCACSFAIFSLENRESPPMEPHRKKEKSQMDFFMGHHLRYKREVSKFVQHNTSLVKCKLKQQLDTTTCLRECPKSRTMMTPNAGEDKEQQDLTFTAGGNASVTANLEDSLSMSCKTKHSLTIHPSSHAPWYLPKWSETLCLCKNLPIDVCGSFIHNCQK